MSRVDVIVPCYNYGRFLRACVESVLRQDGVDVRVLIIDDCSTDDSEAVGRQLAANKGHHPTYNEGIDWLSGEYCLLLSADDMLAPGALARAAAVMDARPEVGLTHGMCVRTSRPGSGTIDLVVTPQVTAQSGPDFVRQRCETGRNLVETPTAVGRTAVQKAVGHYRPALPHTGDMEMWMRYAANGPVAFIHAHQAYYRLHGHNMSTGYVGLRDLQQVKLAFDLFFEAHGNTLPDLAQFRRTAYRKIAEEAFGEAYEAFARGDRQLSRTFARLAHQVDPRTRFAPKWGLLRAKRLLGNRLWGLLRSLKRASTGSCLPGLSGT
jgi:glycosyltransferase involved in cell wall biosynthesis